MFLSSADPYDFKSVVVNRSNFKTFALIEEVSDYTDFADMHRGVGTHPA